MFSYFELRLYYKWKCAVSTTPSGISRSGISVYSHKNRPQSKTIKLDACPFHNNFNLDKNNKHHQFLYASGPNERFPESNKLRPV
jgi:hypothetical protein